MTNNQLQGFDDKANHNLTSGTPIEDTLGHGSFIEKFFRGCSLLNVTRFVRVAKKKR